MLRELAKSLALRVDFSVLHSVFRMSRMARFRSKKPRFPICINLAGEHNLGCSALWASSIGNLPAGTNFVGTPEVRELVVGLGLPQDHFYGIGNLYANFTISHYISLFKVANLASKASEAYIVGADDLDGEYSKLLSGALWNFAIALRAQDFQSRMISFSWKIGAAPFAENMVRRAAGVGVKLFPRDSRSRIRIEELVGPVERNASDIAFALPTNPAIGGFVEPFPSGNKVALLGAPHPLAKNSNGSFELMLAIMRAFPEGTEFTWFPSVVRPGQDDIETQRKLTEALSTGFTITRVAREIHPAEFMTMVGGYRVAVAFRMHPAILAMKQGTPTIMFDYQDKMLGLSEDMGLKNVVLPASLPLTAVTSSLKAFYSRSIELRADIASSLSLMHSRAMRNFDNV